MSSKIIPAEVVARANGALRSLSVTGVGSSALGSAAFAWDISGALNEPVAAIVPGYGVADVAAQAIGGWLMGMQFAVKQQTQTLLAEAAPDIAAIGRNLQRTAEHEELNGVPVFARGSGSADVLHHILGHAPQFTELFGHSKGRL